MGYFKLANLFIFYSIKKKIQKQSNFMKKNMLEGD